MAIAIGIDLGATAIKAMAFTVGGEVLAQTTTPTRDGAIEAGLPAWAPAVRRIVAELEAHAAGGEVRVGLSAPGLAARDGRSIAVMPGRMTGLAGFDWTTYLGRSVPVLNDAHAALVGEVWQGAARGARDAVLLTLGTGVGGAILSEGRLLKGHIGRAGHLGHLCLDPDGAPGIMNTPGTLEQAMGDCTVAARTEGRFTTTRALVEAASAGDAVAGRVWRRSLRVLACAIASIVNAVDPERVVLSGGITEAGPRLFDPLAAELDAVEWRPLEKRVTVVPATLGAWAGAYGAARSALDGAVSAPGGKASA